MTLNLKYFNLSKNQVHQIIKESTLISILLLFFVELLGCYTSEQIKTSDSHITCLDQGDSEVTLNKNSAGVIKTIDSELDKQRRIWLEHKIVNYNITVTGFQGGNVIPPENILIEVRNGKGVVKEMGTTHDPITLKIYEEFDTIDKMFNEIQLGIENNAEVNVQYNKKFGYPEKWFVNYLQKGTDKGKGITINKFEAIN